MKRALIVAAGLALAALPASAQVVRDQIVAQSNFVNRTAVPIPQISMVVRADFVLFSVKYTTSTRSEAARKDELSKQFQTVTERARKAEGVIIEVGTPGNSASLETAAMKELIANQGADRSAMDLVLKVAVREKDTFETIRARTEKFVADTPLTGRVEGIIGDSQFLGLSEPKKHRDALIKAISEDVKMMQASFGGATTPVAVNLTGMEGRVVSRPVGPLDLEIYIPYQMSLRSGRNE
jgi:hypothetical protein